MPSLSNLSNNLTNLSDSIPIPVSSTVIVKLHISSIFLQLQVSFISPFSVYFIAFDNKLFTISLTCTLSPSNSSGISSLISTLKSIFLSQIFIESILASLLISSLKLYGIVIISILEDSILLISNILPIISRSVLLAFIISILSSFTCFGNLSNDEISSDKPTIAFNGVLISWDILLKKSDFALLALSAWFFAIFKASIIFTSGFSIVKYMIAVTNASTTVNNNNSGFIIWIIVTIILPINKNKIGIYSFFFKFFMFLNKQFAIKIIHKKAESINI